MDLENLEKKVQHSLDSIQSYGRINLAFSGGVDSLVLLHLLVKLRDKNPQINLNVIHINHQLNESAGLWQEQCQTVCEELAVSFKAITVDARAHSGESPEAKARELRYQRLAAESNDNDLIALAHHQNDQAETLLIQMLRGSGVAGLAAMPELSSQSAINKPASRLWRPLLTISRQRIQEYADSLNLNWIEDPSNQSRDYDRNYVRHEVMPIILQRWPSAKTSLSRVSRLQAEASEISNRYAKLLLDQLNPDQLNYLDCNRLLKLDSIDLKALLRYWIKSFNYAVPSEVQLKELVKNVISSKRDACPLVKWSNIEARRFKNHLYIFPELKRFDNLVKYDWSMQSKLKLNEIDQILIAKHATQGGIHSELCNKKLQVSYRRGGESYKDMEGKLKSLKKIYQHLDLPVWVRDRTPLISSNNEVIALGDLWVSPSCLAVKDEPGYLFELLSYS